jgi:hypothetical protein
VRDGGGVGFGAVPGGRAAELVARIVSTLMLKELENEELAKLRNYFERLSVQIRKGQLQWYFDIKLFEIGTAEPAIISLIKDAYHDALPEKARITETSFEDFCETLDYWFTTDYSGKPPVKWLIRGEKYFAYLLNECIQRKDSRIYEYQTREPLDPLGSGISGNFAFIFVNPKQHRALILSGGDCD